MFCCFTARFVLDLAINPDTFSHDVALTCNDINTYHHFVLSLQPSHFHLYQNIYHYLLSLPVATSGLTQPELQLISYIENVYNDS